MNDRSLGAFVYVCSLASSAKEVPLAYRRVRTQDGL